MAKRKEAFSKSDIQYFLTYDETLIWLHQVMQIYPELQAKMKLIMQQHSVFFTVI